MLTHAGDTPDWLAAQAHANPGRLALIAGDVRWTFADLDRRARRAARQLAALGVGEGSRVAVLLRNRAPYVTVTHALTRIGAVLVPLGARLTPAELAWQLSDASPDALVSDPELTPRAVAAARVLPSVVLVSVGGRPPGLDARVFELDETAEADVPLRDRVDLDSVQGLVYTSATSGRPKGVLLTYGNHWWSAIGSALRLGLRSDDRWLAPLPLSHVGGLAVVWRSVIYGTAMVLHDAFDPAAVNREIDDGDISIASLVAVMLERVLAARQGRPFPPRLRCILLGGGPIPTGLLAACGRAGVPVAATYGLTEAASQVATLSPDDAARKPGSAGPPLLPTRVRIDVGGRRGAAGEVGEILVAGPTVMRGYAGRPDETRRILHDGWLRTGDMGYLDSDGDLFVVDRRDDLIITGGENVYPAEVEAVLREHPAVADAAVVAVPDRVWAQAVGAAVVLRTGASASIEDLRRFAGSRLAQYKLPRYVWLVDTLPRSPGGKLLRRSIRQRIADENPSGSADPGEQGKPTSSG